MRTKLMTILFATALLGLLSTQAQAKPSVAARTRDIKSGIADWINARKLGYVNHDIGTGQKAYTVKRSELRIRTVRAPAPIATRGVEWRDVAWQLGRPGVLKGTAKASTPVALQNARTSVYEIKIVPKGMHAERNNNR